MKPHIPSVGFVSLGCPKALVDSERILTQLRAEGYAISPSYQDADLVVPDPSGRETCPVTGVRPLSDQEAEAIRHPPPRHR